MCPSVWSVGSHATIASTEGVFCDIDPSFPWRDGLAAEPCSSWRVAQLLDLVSIVPDVAPQWIAYLSPRGKIATRGLSAAILDFLQVEARKC